MSHSLKNSEKKSQLRDYAQKIYMLKQAPRIKNQKVSNELIHYLNSSSSQPTILPMIEHNFFFTPKKRTSASFLPFLMERDSMNRIIGHVIFTVFLLLQKERPTIHKKEIYESVFEVSRNIANKVSKSTSVVTLNNSDTKAVDLSGIMVKYENRYGKSPKMIEKHPSPRIPKLAALNIFSSRQNIKPEFGDYETTNYKKKKSYAAFFSNQTHKELLYTKPNNTIKEDVSKEASKVYIKLKIKPTAALKFDKQLGRYDDLSLNPLMRAPPKERKDFGDPIEVGPEWKRKAAINYMQFLEQEKQLFISSAARVNEMAKDVKKSFENAYKEFEHLKETKY